MTPPIEVSITSENVKNLTDKEISIVSKEAKRRLEFNLKQSSESIEKLPELETENYKIDKDLSPEEKLKNGRTRETDPNGIVYLQKDLSPEEKDEDKKAYVKEYLEGVDEEFIGEQKFNLFAVDKLGLRSGIVKDYETFKKIRGGWIKENKSNHLGFMQKYFSKNGKLMLSGFRYPDSKIFFSIGLRESCLLGDGFNVLLNKYDVNHFSYDPRFGFSVRLLKSA